MSSTNNVQNILVNVFRPVYRYDATTTLYTPNIEMSNIDTYSGNTVSVFTAAIGDSSFNVYVGSNAGNPFTATRLCRNVTAVGFSAGANISNVSNAVYLGYNAGTGAVGASNVVAIGANAIGDGTSNVYVGANTGGTGSSNIYIGTSNTGLGSNNILIGQGIAAGSSNNTLRIGSGLLYGNLTTKWLGIGTSTPYDSNDKLDVSGNLYVFGQQGINMVPVRTLDVNGNFRASDSNGTLDFNGGQTQSTGGFSSSSGTITLAGLASTTNIATLKKGIIMVSAQDSANSTTHFESTMIYCSDAANGTYTTAMTNATQSGDVTIKFQTGGSNIQISNANSIRTINWSVTYFPLP